MFKIAFIIPYFGTFPFWMSFFLKSCSTNSNYSWYIYTDCELDFPLPSNVFIKKISFDKYKEKVSQKLNINFNPDSAYKLCDIKPALGYIHRDDISEYDFIAFGDIDLIYGRLDSFITNKKLSKFDIISTHSRRISGHLCVMRNEDSTLELFKKVKDWKKILSDPKHRHFDEKSFSDLFVKHKNFPEWLRSIVCSLYPLTRRVSFNEAYSTPFMKIPWFKDLLLPKKWYWDNGKLTTDSDEKIELPYYHFLYWKKYEWNKLTKNNLLPANSYNDYTKFSVKKNGFDIIQ